MFKKKVKEDPTELQLLKIRVQNLEKEIAELKRAPQVQAEELKDRDDAVSSKTLTEQIVELTNKNKKIES